MQIEIEEVGPDLQATGRYWNVTVDLLPRVGEGLIIAMANKGEVHTVRQISHRVGLDHFITVKAMLNG